MQQVILALWPLFALMGMGYFLANKAWLKEDFWRGAEKLNYYLLFPALLISGLAAAPLDNPQLPRLAWAVLLILAAAWVLLLVYRKALALPSARFGVDVQGVLRFNTYLALAVVMDLWGQNGLAISALIMAVLIPSCNVLSVWAFTAEKGVSVRSLLLPMTKNPLILSCLAGVILNLSHVGLPFGSAGFLKMLASTSLPLGLLCIGAALNIEKLLAAFKVLLGVCVVRLVLMPILAFAVAKLVGLGGMELALLTLFFAVPTAPTAYVLAKQLGGDSDLMAGVISLETVLSVFSLPLVLSALLMLT